MYPVFLLSWEKSKGNVQSEICMSTEYITKKIRTSSLEFVHFARFKASRNQSFTARCSLNVCLNVERYFVDFVLSGKRAYNYQAKTQQQFEYSNAFDMLLRSWSKVISKREAVVYRMVIFMR